MWQTFRRRKNSMLFIVVGIIEVMHLPLSLSLTHFFNIVVWSAFFPHVWLNEKRERKQRKKARVQSTKKSITLCNVSAHWTWIAACSFLIRSRIAVHKNTVTVSIACCIQCTNKWCGPHYLWFYYRRILWFIVCSVHMVKEAPSRANTSFSECMLSLNYEK